MSVKVPMKIEAHFCRCVSMLSIMYVFNMMRDVDVFVVWTLISLTQNSFNDTGGGFRQHGASACVCVYVCVCVVCVCMCKRERKRARERK